MKKRTTIKDLAKALGLSTSTVSRALTDSWEINPETRKNVLAMAEKMNYRPNPVSLSLKNRQSGLIGVIVPEFINEFFPEVIIGIQSVLDQKGYNVLICQSNESEKQELENLRLLESKMVDGIIISLCENSGSVGLLREMIEDEMPVVVFNRGSEDIPAPMVMIDDRKWALKAVEHLIGQGCRKIVHLAGPEDLLVARNRSQGYIDALAEYGLPFERTFIVPCGLMIEDGFQGMEELLSNGFRPDGVFAVNDPVAIGAIKALKAHNIKIPEETAVIGFTETKMSTVIEPNLSSVRQPTFEMGKKAAELLMEQLGERHKHITGTTLIEAQLNVRESSRLLKAIGRADDGDSVSSETYGNPDIS